MKKEQANVYLSKMKDKIDMGLYDKDLSLPFMSRKLFYANIKSIVNEKLRTRGTPLLSSTEIDTILSDMKEAAVLTTAIFLEAGIMEKTVDGYKVSEKIKSKLK